MKKRYLLAIVLPLAAGAVIALIASLKNDDGESPQQQPGRMPPPMVDTVPARRGVVARVLDLTGEIAATNHAVISSTKEGPITYYPWREGDLVEAGEKLVEIDREVHRAEVNAQRAALEMARARLDDLRAGARPEAIQKAEAEVKRWESTFREALAAYERRVELLAGDVVTSESVEQALERMEVAEAQLVAARENLAMLKAGPTATEIAVQEAAVKEAEAKMELAEAHLAECVIHATFAGTVTRTHARKGELAAPRMPLLEIADMSSLVIRFAVPEAHAGAVAVGMELSASLDSYPGRRLRAKVVRVYPELDRRLRSRTVEAVLIGDIEPAPGMFARISLELERAEGAIVVPADAVVENNSGSAVFVFKDGKARLRPVSIGITDGRNVQIIDGLAEGEQVITTVTRNLRDGADARVKSPDAGRSRPANGDSR